MGNQSILVRIAALLGALAILLVCFVVIVRPWFLNWGATDQERRMALPGDEIVPGVGSQQTRAITIEAGASRVWPWLAQTGQDRGGFYSVDLLENLAGFLASGIVFQILTLGQPPLLIGFALLAALGAILCWPGLAERAHVSRADTAGTDPVGQQAVLT